MGVDSTLVLHDSSHRHSGLCNYHLAPREIFQAVTFCQQSKEQLKRASVARFVLRMFDLAISFRSCKLTNPGDRTAEQDIFPYSLIV